MTETYKTDILGAIHETAEDLYAAGVMDKQTLRQFDEACLTEVMPMPPEKIRALREACQVSQSVFARYLNVTASLVSKWERGEKHPAGASLKLLNLVESKGLDGIA
ncbi:MAG: helix-turn-helix domain-containing protein [Gammaproteobacteria bacterium]